MALSIPERIAQVAEHFAAHGTHGYSQYNRGTGDPETIKLSDGAKVSVSSADVDCSEMARQCVNAALSGSYKSPIVYMWTGNEDEQLKSVGFKRIAFAKSKVQRGDLLLRSGHTAIVTSPTKQAEAVHDENYGIGGRSGDQTGTEVAVNALSSNWTYIYRYGDTMPPAFVGEASHTFKKKSRVHVELSTKSDYTYTYQPGESVILDRIYIHEGYFWGSYIGSKGARRYVVLGTASRVE